MTDHDGLFQPAFEHSPIGMLISDTNGLVVAINRAYSLLSGHQERNLVGTPAEDLLHPDDLAHERRLAQELTSGRLPSYQVQNRILHHSGDIVWTRSTVSRVVDDHGVERYIAQVEDLTEVRRAKELLEHRSLHDHLTGLPNRAYLLEWLAKALELPASANAPALACLYLDIDHLTIVNDSLGHQAGDTLLVEIARRIRSAVRTDDVVARLGGDEFVVIASDIEDQEAAQGLMAVICAAIKAPIDLEGHEVVTTVSAGLAMAVPGITAESLVRNADTAMSHAKQAGRNRTEVFAEQLRQSALVRLSIESELRNAIREGQLVVHYQPIVDLVTQEPIAYEALVRWDHPNRGLLHPQDFLDICEEANLMVQLGAFVLHQACQFIVDHPEFTGRVLVNASTRQIGSADLSRVVRAALDSAGVHPSRLGIEITESGMLLATQVEQSDLTALSDMGIDLVIDDFGTGYSALSSVLQNPVSGIKLAREFTLRLGDGSTGDRISTAVAHLAESLGVYGVIEGIETEAQHAQALRHGWRFGQGYLFAYPQPSHKITSALGAAGLPHRTPASAASPPRIVDTETTVASVTSDAAPH